MNIIKIANSAATDGLLHFYAPIAFYDGKILKYQGIVNENNEAICREKNPDGIILDTYMGDRIRAHDFSVV